MVEFHIFAREGCKICTKAQQVLSRLGVPYQVRYVDGPTATVENLADFAYYDWTDSPPLVVAIDGGQVLARWDGETIGDEHQSWHLTVERWLNTYRSSKNQPG
jgi:hypothetical protein|uniref:Glutaredoxin domain-containing protein n=1 Tax=candidate division WOR-3 bacterium TaxID=2052148 RepID=A0A7V3PUE4_UNCW3